MRNPRLFVDQLQETIFNALMDIGWLQPRLTIQDLAEVAEDVATAVATALPEGIEA